MVGRKSAGISLNDEEKKRYSTSRRKGKFNIPRWIGKSTLEKIPTELQQAA